MMQGQTFTNDQHRYLPSAHGKEKYIKTCLEIVIAHNKKDILKILATIAVSIMLSIILSINILYWHFSSTCSG